MSLLVLAVDLLLLTAPDGKYLSVAPSQVVALRGAATKPEGTLHKGVRCVVFTVDGKFLSVVETCPEVSRKLKAYGVVLGVPG
jgi:hypothetical protein